MRFVVAVLLVICAAAPATADDKAKAAEHYRQGKVFEKAKAYDRAIAEFQQAYSLDQQPAHLFNIGLDYELVPELKNALDYFQRYLTAQPTGPKAAEARTRIKEDTQKLLDDDTRRVVEEARIATEQKKLKDEQDAAAKKAKDEQDAAAKKTTVVAHLKQAVAYGQAGAWAKAGEEHRAAAAIDGDPQHLIDAADAFHKQPDDVRARDALLAYLGKVPLGETSDRIRVRVAELTRSIEKAEVIDQADRQRIAALQLAGLTTPEPKRRISFGFELRGGTYGPGSFATNAPFMEVKAQPGPAVGFGAFVDFPGVQPLVWGKASRIRFGVRAQTFKSSYEDTCNASPMCPTNISGTHWGPAYTHEQSLIHEGRLDVFLIGGVWLGIPLGKGKISFSQGAQDQDLTMKPTVELELGLGARFAGVGVSAVYQIGSNPTDNLDLSHASGIMVVAGWKLPR